MFSSDFQTHPVFKRGVAPHVRLLAYAAVCVVMMVADLRFHYLTTLQDWLSIITYPIRDIAAQPANLIGDTTGYFSNLRDWQAEKEKLLQRKKEDTEKLLVLKELEQENDRLRSLLKMARRVKTYSVAATVQYRAPDPYSRKVILDLGARELFDIQDPTRFVLDQGKQSGITHGWPVVDADGLIGQITRVYPIQSEVTLITDRNQAVAVKIERTGQPGVTFGTGQGQLELRNVRSDPNIKPGDRLVTSGLDGLFVPGIPVATVEAVEPPKVNDIFPRIVCTPISGVERSTNVLVLSRAELPPVPPKPETGDPPPPPRPNEPNGADEED